MRLYAVFECAACGGWHFVSSEEERAVLPRCPCGARRWELAGSTSFCPPALKPSPLRLALRRLLRRLFRESVNPG